eukprot:5560097-Amphidinium_carterae.2
MEDSLWGMSMQTRRFESGGSSGSGALASPTLRARQVSPTPSSTRQGILRREASQASHSDPPILVGMTILQPTLPEPAHPLVGLVVDEVDQMAHVPCWPAVRLPMQVDRSTILTLRLYRASGNATPSSIRSNAFVGGLRIPAGALLAHGTAVQCWCALSTDVGLLDRTAQPESALVE